MVICVEISDSLRTWPLGVGREKSGIIHVVIYMWNSDYLRTWWFSALVWSSAIDPCCALYMCVYVYMQIYMYMYIHMYICICICIYICI